MGYILTALEIGQLARFDEHWRVILAGDSACQLSKLTSLPARSRTRGRATFTLPPW